MASWNFDAAMVINRLPERAATGPAWLRWLLLPAGSQQGLLLLLLRALSGRGGALRLDRRPTGR